MGRSGGKIEGLFLGGKNEYFIEIFNVKIVIKIYIYMILMNFKPRLIKVLIRYRLLREPSLRLSCLPLLFSLIR
jgi:hypothetical protein